MRQRGSVAIFAERRDDRRRHVDVRLALQRLDENVEGVAAAKIAEEVDERKADVDVAFDAQPVDDRNDGVIADPDQCLGRGIALAGVLGVRERVQQSRDDLGLRITHEPIDDGLAHAPVLVAEQLEHQRVVALVDHVRDQIRRLLPRIGIGGTRLFDEKRVGVHRSVPVISRPISSRFMRTNCCSVSEKISVFWRTRSGTRES